MTFAELMTQLKHYSPGTRKDALLGLKDLFHRHPHLLPLHLGVLVNSVVRLLIDDVSVSSLQFLDLGAMALWL